MIINVRGVEFDPNYINKIEIRNIPDGRGEGSINGLWITFTIGNTVKIPIGSESDAIKVKTQLVTELNKLGLYHQLDI